MSTGSGPTRRTHNMQSQVSMDAFAEWKRQQAELVTRRGEDVRNPDAEEAHNKSMMRHCLNAYICHLELDMYAGCLKKHGLWGTKSDEYEVPTKAPMHQVKCPMPLEKYTQCMGNEDNHSTLTANAIMNPNCRSFHKTFYACIVVNRSKSIEETERECAPAYRRLLRCGLNHLWEEYYRAVNNVGDQEDFQSFEIHGDPKKREMFTTLVMDTQRRIEGGDTALTTIYSPKDPEDLREKTQHSEMLHYALALQPAGTETLLATPLETESRNANEEALLDLQPGGTFLPAPHTYNYSLKMSRNCPFHPAMELPSPLVKLDDKGVGQSRPIPLGCSWSQRQRDGQTGKDGCGAPDASNFFDDESLIKAGVAVRGATLACIPRTKMQSQKNEGAQQSGSDKDSNTTQVLSRTSVSLSSGNAELLATLQTLAKMEEDARRKAGGNMGATALFGCRSDANWQSLSGKSLLHTSPTICATASKCAENSSAGPRSPSLAAPNNKERQGGEGGLEESNNRWFSIRAVAPPTLRVTPLSDAKPKSPSSSHASGGTAMLPLRVEYPTATFAIGREMATCSLNLIAADPAAQQAVVSRRHCEVDTRLVEYTFDALLREITKSDSSIQSPQSKQQQHKQVRVGEEAGRKENEDEDNADAYDEREALATSKDTQVTSVAKASMFVATLRIRCAVTTVRDCGTVNGTLLWAHKIGKGLSSGSIVSTREEEARLPSSSTTGEGGSNEGCNRQEDAKKTAMEGKKQSLCPRAVAEMFGSSLVDSTSVEGIADSAIAKTLIRGGGDDGKVTGVGDGDFALYTRASARGGSDREVAAVCLQFGAASAFKTGEKVTPIKNVHATLHLTVGIGEKKLEGNVSAVAPPHHFSALVLGHLAPYHGRGLGVAGAVLQVGEDNQTRISTKAALSPPLISPVRSPNVADVAHHQLRAPAGMGTAASIVMSIIGDTAIAPPLGSATNASTTTTAARPSDTDGLAREGWHDRPRAARNGAGSRSPPKTSPLRDQAVFLSNASGPHTGHSVNQEGVLPRDIGTSPAVATTTIASPPTTALPPEKNVNHLYRPASSVLLGILQATDEDSRGGGGGRGYFDERGVGEVNRRSAALPQSPPHHSHGAALSSPLASASNFMPAATTNSASSAALTIIAATSASPALHATPSERATLLSDALIARQQQHHNHQPASAALRIGERGTVDISAARGGGGGAPQNMNIASSNTHLAGDSLMPPKPNSTLYDFEMNSNVGNSNTCTKQSAIGDSCNALPLPSCDHFSGGEASRAVPSSSGPHIMGTLIEPSSMINATLPLPQQPPSHQEGAAQQGDSEEVSRNQAVAKQDMLTAAGAEAHANSNFPPAPAPAPLLTSDQNLPLESYCVVEGTPQQHGGTSGDTSHTINTNNMGGTIRMNNTAKTSNQIEDNDSGGDKTTTTAASPSNKENNNTLKVNCSTAAAATGNTGIEEAFGKEDKSLAPPHWQTNQSYLGFQSCDAPMTADNVNAALQQDDEEEKRAQQDPTKSTSLGRTNLLAIVPPSEEEAPRPVVVFSEEEKDTDGNGEEVLKKPAAEEEEGNASPQVVGGRVRANACDEEDAPVVLMRGGRQRGGAVGTRTSGPAFATSNNFGNPARSDATRAQAANTKDNVPNTHAKGGRSSPAPAPAVSSEWKGRGAASIQRATAEPQEPFREDQSMAMARAPALEPEGRRTEPIAVVASTRAPAEGATPSYAPPSSVKSHSIGVLSNRFAQSPSPQNPYPTRYLNASTAALGGPSLPPMPDSPAPDPQSDPPRFPVRTHVVPFAREPSPISIPLAVAPADPTREAAAERARRMMMVAGSSGNCEVPTDIACGATFGVADTKANPLSSLHYNQNTLAGTGGAPDISSGTAIGGYTATMNSLWGPPPMPEETQMDVNITSDAGKQTTRGRAELLLPPILPGSARLQSSSHSLQAGGLPPSAHAVFSQTHHAAEDVNALLEVHLSQERRGPNYDLVQRDVMPALSRSTTIVSAPPPPPKLTAAQKREAKRKELMEKNAQKVASFIAELRADDEDKDKANNGAEGQEADESGNTKRKRKLIRTEALVTQQRDDQEGAGEGKSRGVGVEVGVDHSGVDNKGLQRSVVLTNISGKSPAPSSTQIDYGGYKSTDQLKPGGGFGAALTSTTTNTNTARLKGGGGKKEKGNKMDNDDASSEEDNIAIGGMRKKRAGAASARVVKTENSNSNVGGVSGGTARTASSDASLEQQQRLAAELKAQLDFYKKINDNDGAELRPENEEDQHYNSRGGDLACDDVGNYSDEADDTTAFSQLDAAQAKKKQQRRPQVQGVSHHVTSDFDLTCRFYGATAVAAQRLVRLSQHFEQKKLRKNSKSSNVDENRTVEGASSQLFSQSQAAGSLRPPAPNTKRRAHIPLPLPPNHRHDPPDGQGQERKEGRNSGLQQQRPHDTLTLAESSQLGLLRQDTGTRRRGTAGQDSYQGESTTVCRVVKIGGGGQSQRNGHDGDDEGVDDDMLMLACPSQAQEVLFTDYNEHEEQENRRDSYVVGDAGAGAGNALRDDLPPPEGLEGRSTVFLINGKRRVFPTHGDARSHSSSALLCLSQGLFEKEEEERERDGFGRETTIKRFASLRGRAGTTATKSSACASIGPAPTIQLVAGHLALHDARQPDDEDENYGYGREAPESESQPTRAVKREEDIGYPRSKGYAITRNTAEEYSHRIHQSLKAAPQTRLPPPPPPPSASYVVRAAADAVVALQRERLKSEMLRARSTLLMKSSSSASAPNRGDVGSLLSSQSVGSEVTHKVSNGVNVTPDRHRYIEMLHRKDANDLSYGGHQQSQALLFDDAASSFLLSQQQQQESMVLVASQYYDSMCASAVTATSATHDAAGGNVGLAMNIHARASGVGLPLLGSLSQGEAVAVEVEAVNLSLDDNDDDDDDNDHYYGDTYGDKGVVNGDDVDCVITFESPSRRNHRPLHPSVLVEDVEEVTFVKEKAADCVLNRSNRRSNFFSSSQGVGNSSPKGHRLPAPAVGFGGATSTAVHVGPKRLSQQLQSPLQSQREGNTHRRDISKANGELKELPPKFSSTATSSYTTTASTITKIKPTLASERHKRCVLAVEGALSMVRDPADFAVRGPAHPPHHLQTPEGAATPTKVSMPATMMPEGFERGFATSAHAAFEWRWQAEQAHEEERLVREALNPPKIYDEDEADADDTVGYDGDTDNYYVLQNGEEGEVEDRETSQLVRLQRRVLQRALNADVTNTYLLEYGGDASSLLGMANHTSPSASASTNTNTDMMIGNYGAPAPAIAVRSLALPEDSQGMEKVSALVAGNGATPTQHWAPFAYDELYLVPKALFGALQAHQRDALRFMWSRLLYRPFSGWFGENASPISTEALLQGLLQGIQVEGLESVVGGHVASSFSFPLSSSHVGMLLFSQLESRTTTPLDHRYGGIAAAGKAMELAIAHNRGLRGFYLLLQISLAQAVHEHVLKVKCHNPSTSSSSHPHQGEPKKSAAKKDKSGSSSAKPYSSPSAALMAVIQQGRRTTRQLLSSATTDTANANTDTRRAPATVGGGGVYKFSFEEDSDGGASVNSNDSLLMGSKQQKRSAYASTSTGNADSSKKCEADEPHEEDQSADNAMNLPLSPDEELLLSRACAVAQVVRMLVLNQYLPLSLPSLGGANSFSPSIIDVKKGAPSLPTCAPDAPRSVVLGHSMGLGKTFTTISFFASLWSFTEQQRAKVCEAMQALVLDVLIPSVTAYEGYRRRCKGCVGVGRSGDKTTIARPRPDSSGSDSAEEESEEEEEDYYDELLRPPRSNRAKRRTAAIGKKSARRSGTSRKGKAATAASSNRNGAANSNGGQKKRIRFETSSSSQQVGCAEGNQTASEPVLAAALTCTPRHTDAHFAELLRYLTVLPPSITFAATVSSCVSSSAPLSSVATPSPPILSYASVRIIVVVPKSVTYHWIREFSRWAPFMWGDDDAPPPPLTTAATTAVSDDAMGEEGCDDTNPKGHEEKDETPPVAIFYLSGDRKRPAGVEASAVVKQETISPASGGGDSSATKAKATPRGKAATTAKGRGKNNKNKGDDESKQEGDPNSKNKDEAGINFKAPPLPKDQNTNDDEESNGRRSQDQPSLGDALQVTNPFPDDHRAALVTAWANTSGRSVLLVTHAMLTALMKEEGGRAISPAAGATAEQIGKAGTAAKSKPAGKRAGAAAKRSRGASDFIDSDDADEPNDRQGGAGEDDEEMDEDVLWSDDEEVARSARRRKGVATSINKQSATSTANNKGNKTSAKNRKKEEWEEDLDAIFGGAPSKGLLLEEEANEKRSTAAAAASATSARKPKTTSKARAELSQSTEAEKEKGAAPKQKEGEIGSTRRATCANKPPPSSARVYCRTLIAQKANVIAVDEAHKLQTSPSLLSALNAIDAIRASTLAKALDSPVGRGIMCTPYGAAVVASAMPASAMMRSSPSAGDRDEEGGGGRPSTTVYDFDIEDDAGGKEQAKSENGCPEAVASTCATATTNSLSSHNAYRPSPWGSGDRQPPTPLQLFDFFASLTPPVLKIALTGTPLGVSPSYANAHDAGVTSPSVSSSLSTRNLKGPKEELFAILPWADKTPAAARRSTAALSITTNGSPNSSSMGKASNSKYLSSLQLTLSMQKELALRSITQIRSLRVVSHLLPALFHTTIVVKHSAAQIAMLKELILIEQERGAIQPKRLLELTTRFLWIGNHCELAAHWLRTKKPMAFEQCPTQTDAKSSATKGGGNGSTGFADFSASTLLPLAQRKMMFRGRASVEWAVPAIGLPSPLTALAAASSSASSANESTEIDPHAVARAAVASLEHTPKMLVLMHVLHESLTENAKYNTHQNRNHSYANDGKVRGGGAGAAAYSASYSSLMAASSSSLADDDDHTCNHPLLPYFYKEKVVVFSHSVKTLFIMGVTLAACSALEDGVDFAVMTGAMGSTMRDELIGRFNNPHDPLRILFLSHRSFDVGTTLTGASRVILYDVSHRLHDDAQAIFRVFRAGQHNEKIHVVQLVMGNRLEQKLSGVASVVEERRRRLTTEANNTFNKPTPTPTTGSALPPESVGPLDMGRAMSADGLIKSLIAVDDADSSYPAAAAAAGGGSTANNNNDSKCRAASLARGTVTAAREKEKENGKGGRAVGEDSVSAAKDKRALALNVLQPLVTFADADPLLVRAVYPPLLSAADRKRATLEGGGSGGKEGEGSASPHRRRTAALQSQWLPPATSQAEEYERLFYGDCQNSYNNAENDIGGSGGCIAYVAHVISERLMN